MFAKFLASPAGNPFRVEHTRSTDKTVLGARHGYHLTWEKKVLPDAVGAGNYAWETYGQPPNARFGFGNIQVQNQSRVTQPANYVFQSVGIVGIPPFGILQGQFVTQPLMDPNEAQLRGIVQPGAIAKAPNAIAGVSPVLAP